MDKERKICVGMIAGAHGIRGLVRVRSFTEDPEDIGTFGALTDESGDTTFHLTLKDVVKDLFTAELKGVTDRDEAENLRGTRLYASRGQMPKIGRKEFYAADLLGLKVLDAAETAYGSVLDVHDHGAGTFLEIGVTRRDSFMLPFKDAFVPEVDLLKGTALITLPEGWRDPPKPEAEDRSDKPKKAGKKRARKAVP